MPCMRPAPRQHHTGTLAICIALRPVSTPSASPKSAICRSGPKRILSVIPAPCLRNPSAYSAAAAKLLSARLFDGEGDIADERAFAERCRGDRHHFRFIVSIEEGVEMTDLKAFTSDLLADMERDLATKLDWVAVEHWNTDNPHVRLLARGKAEDGKDS